RYVLHLAAFPTRRSSDLHAQARPVTAQTSLPQDMTGSGPQTTLMPLLKYVYTSGEPVVGSDEYPYGPPGIAAWPEAWQNEIIAVDRKSTRLNSSHVSNSN